MKESEINKIYVLQTKLKRIDQELKNLEEKNFYKPNIISDMPKGNKGKDAVSEYVDDKMHLENQKEAIKKELEDLKKKFYSFLEKIDDLKRPFVRQIIEERAIDRRRWDDIGNQYGMDRRTVSRQYYKYVVKL